jgi:hypothetical protein
VTHIALLVLFAWAAERFFGFKIPTGNKLLVIIAVVLAGLASCWPQQGPRPRAQAWSGS